jgi:hypothetical protein
MRWDATDIIKHLKTRLVVIVILAHQTKITFLVAQAWRPPSQIASNRKALPLVA